jgi:hypothetical protein
MKEAKQSIVEPEGRYIRLQTSPAIAENILLDARTRLG